MTCISEFNTEQKAEILEEFVDHIEFINSRSGTIYGTLQIIEKLHDIAVKKGFESCPCCGRKS
jgi:hypothetical protein